MLNSVVLMGRLTKTPEVKKGKNGAEFTIASLAVPTAIEDQPMYVDIVCYSDTQKALDFVDKGDQIAVQGRLDCYTFDKADGSKGYGCRVVVNTIEFGSKKMASEEAPVEVEKPAEAPKAEAKPQNARPRR